MVDRVAAGARRRELAGAVAAPVAHGGSPRRGGERLQVLGAALLYLVYALFVTWPVVLDLDGSMFGAPPGDLSGAMAHAREVVQERLFPFAPGTLQDFNAPWGLEEAWVLNLATAPGTAMLYGLTFVFGSVPGHTIFTLLGYVLSGTAMFLLARRVTGSGAAALIAGFAFAFYPFAINKGLGHLHFLHGWVLVLPVWRMLELAWAPSVRNGFFAGLAAAFAMWFTPYFILIAGVAFAAMLLLSIGVAWRHGRLRRGLAGAAAAGAVVVALLAFLLVLQRVAVSEGVGGERTHALSQLVTYSARAHEFVVPDRHNLLFGNRTEPYLAARLHGSNFSENSLYLGISMLVLAAAGAAIAGGGWRRRRPGGEIPRASVAALGAALVGLAGVAFSAPPQITVFGRLVPFPSWFVYQVTETWRVYSRFVVIVMLGVCLLAAIALAALLRGRRTPVAAALASGVLALVAVDLWARPPEPVTDIAVPEIYRELRALGPGAVAEYPILPASVPDSTPMWYQQAHGRPIIAGYPEGSEDESRKLELVDLGDRETAATLATLGVRHVLVRPTYKDYGLGRPRDGAGLRKRFESQEGSIWEVTAEPARSGVDALSGFSLTEGRANDQYRWLGYSEGEVLVWGDCDPCDARLRFAASSQRIARTLRVSDPGGRTLAVKRISVAPSTVEIPVRFRRELRLRLAITPGAEPVPVAPGSAETRPLGIIVAEPRLELLTGGRGSSTPGPR